MSPPPLLRKDCSNVIQKEISDFAQGLARTQLLPDYSVIFHVSIFFHVSVFQIVPIFLVYLQKKTRETPFGKP